MIALTRTCGPERVREPDRHGVDARLRRRVGDDVARRPHRAGARDVDDRPAVARDHPLADERREPERALEVDGDDLVEELLGDVA